MATWTVTGVEREHEGLFPHQNMGLEIASVLMIFTGQVWNMTFWFYSSLKRWS
jgi:ABC-type anion transport system duplicated permease subunit